MRGWYIVHTLTSAEKKTVEFILRKIESGELKDIVYDVKMPIEKTIEMRNGKKVKRERKFFPGYILLDMEMSEQNMRIVRNIPGISGFVGFSIGKFPKPLTQKEIDDILNKSERVIDEEDTVSNKILFMVDENVKINDGPFKGFTGVVEEINHEKGRVKVRVEIFGRATPVDLNFLQIEKIS